MSSEDGAYHHVSGNGIPAEIQQLRLLPSPTLQREPLERHLASAPLVMHPNQTQFAAANPLASLFVNPLFI